MSWEEYEKKYHSRKHSRNERKRLSSSDRSQFTKKNQSKVDIFDPPSAEDEKTLAKGFVREIFSQEVAVHCLHEKKTYTCSLRGALKKNATRLKNLLVVGDHVLFRKENIEQGLICNILPRKSSLSRAGAYTRHREHILAANLDQLFITVSLSRPCISSSLIDRFIISCLKGNITPSIVLNKVDLIYEERLEKELKTLLDAYQAAGVKTYVVSAKTKEGLKALQEGLAGKVSSFVGPSGTGKSSLLSILLDRELKTGAIVERTLKGAHTTTRSEAFFLQGSGIVIDTPGIKSFALWQVSEEELQQYFPEIRRIGEMCYYQNCRHLEEPDCAVKKAVENNELSEARYTSYAHILQNMKSVDKLR
jgi:ribosome biogenesis GTPase